MSSDWPLKELVLIADEVTVGFVGSMASEYVESGVPFLRSLNIDQFRINMSDLKFVTPGFHQRIKKSTLRPGDVVIVRTGKPGTCAVIPDWLQEANCSDLVVVRCGKEIRPHFLCYWVNSVATHHIESHTVGAVQQHFNVGAAKTMKVAVPALHKQDQVVELLKGIDDRITILRETNTTLEAIAQALFKSWFVDFDPVRAKQEGREPEGMDAATAALFPDSFEESELGPVPVGWLVTNCQKIIDVRDGTHESPKSSPVGFPLITSRHITGGKINFDDTYLISEQDYENISKRSKVHRLDVLITMIGTVGLTVIVMEDEVEFAIKNIGLFKTSAVPHLCHYFYLLLSSSRMQQYLEARLAGTTQKYLSLKALREIAVLAPSELVLGAFSKIVAPVFERIHQNNSQAQTIATLRDTLLPRLISGQLRLPDAETILEVANA